MRTMLMTMTTVFLVGTSAAAQPPVPPVRRSVPMMQRAGPPGPGVMRARAFSGRGGRAVMARRAGPRGGLGRVEQALRARERLALSDDQVARLEALRAAVLVRRAAVSRRTDPLVQILTEEQRSELRLQRRGRGGAPGLARGGRAGARGPAARGGPRGPFVRR